MPLQNIFVWPVSIPWLFANFPKQAQIAGRSMPDLGEETGLGVAIRASEPDSFVESFGGGDSDAASSADISRALSAANLLRDSCRLPEARAAYEALLQQWPNNAWARNGLGQVLRMLGDLAGALAQFEAAAVADPDHVSFRLDIANALRDSGRLPEAKVIYEDILGKAPNDAWALNGLGQVLRALGNHTS